MIPSAPAAVAHHLTHKPTITTRDLGRLGYAESLDLQRELNQRVIDGEAPPTILLVEHDPVITLTRRPSVRDHLLADDAQLSALGIATHQTDRGGDITYHGPGQLVVYPILKLGEFGLNLSSYMRLLEQAVIDTAWHWGIAGHNECGATGVWVGDAMADGECRMADVEPTNGGRDARGLADPNLQRPIPNPPTAKLCAMGVRIRKNTTMHGLALNVAPDMTHFDLIVPCGLDGRAVTSMQELLGEQCPAMQAVKDQLVKALTERLMQGV